MSVEQAHQRLGIAEGVTHELQEQLQRVCEGHQAMHQELSALRSQADTRSRVRLVEPKTLMPDRFGTKNGPSWRTWSHLARDFVGVVHATLKQAMKASENQKQPISVTHLQHEFNVTNEMDQELQHCLISRTEGGKIGCSIRPTSSWEEPESCQNIRPLTHHPSLGKS